MLPNIPYKQGLCPASCNLVIPQAALSSIPPLKKKDPPTPGNLPPFSGFEVGYRAVNRWYFSWLAGGQIPMVTPEQQLALSYTALSGNNLPLFCTHRVRPDEFGLHREGVLPSPRSQQNALLSCGVIVWACRFKRGKR